MPIEWRWSVQFLPEMPNDMNIHNHEKADRFNGDFVGVLYSVLGVVLLSNSYSTESVYWA